MTNQNYYDKQLYLLKTFHHELVELLDNHFSGIVTDYDEKINQMYLQLCVKIQEILEDNIVSGKRSWRRIDNLLTEESGDSIDWENGTKKHYFDYQSHFEETFIKNGSKEVTLDNSELKLLTKIRQFNKDYKKKKDLEKISVATSALAPLGIVANLFSGSSKDSKEKIYDVNDQYGVYKDLKNFVKNATNEVFIIDGYVDERLFDLYIDSIPQKVQIKILTKKPTPKFITISKLFAKKYQIEIRKSKTVHDRYLFVDNNCWMIGASFKDAGKRPTVLIQINGKNELYNLWKSIFDKGEDLLA